MAESVAVTQLLSTYVPMDRRHALAAGTTLPAETRGTALFADISGFTPLAEALAQALGPRRGAEELLRTLNRICDVLVGAVHRYRGSVIGFAGDAVTCWFDETSCAAPAALRAATCAMEMQQEMEQFSDTPSPIALKVAMASGPARRFLVGDRDRGYVDIVAGKTIDRMAAAEHCAGRGETVADAATVAELGDGVHVAEWRDAGAEGAPERFALLGKLAARAPRCDWEPLAPGALTAEQVRPWVLPAVYERLQTGLGEFLAELRPAVALFLRFVGIDFESDPEAGEKLGAFIQRTQQIVGRYEGVVLQVTVGDKGAYFYANFGAPVAHEDDAYRAVQAGLLLREAAAEMGTLAPVQIGISQGMTRTGAYGGTAQRTYGVQGDEVNLAARLMTQAAPGELLISGRVHKALPPEFSCEPRMPVRPKGKTEPVPVFAVVAITRQRAMRLQEPVFALPMVGRTAELALLEERLALALDGHGQVVGITGEAGIGKTRLAAEVIRLARRAGFTGYGGACQADGVNTSYLAWKPVWQAFFDIDPAAPLRRQLRHLEMELTDRAPERVEAMPLLSAVLDVPLPDNDLTRALEPRFRKSALEALLLDCLGSSAREAAEEGTGLLLVLEDLHWLDSASADLLALVARAIADLPVLLVLAYRQSEDAESPAAGCEGLPYFTCMRLGELRAVDVEQMIRAKLAQLYPEGQGSVLPTLIARLGARVQGNPFYLEELLNYLHDRGFDPRDPGTLEALELPDSLQRLVLARIDRLTTHQQLTLKVASVLGRLFWLSHLHGYYPALGDTPELKADMAVLARLDVAPLDARAASAGADAELAYLFRHIVTHEVAYETLPRATRAFLHGQYGRYLEAQSTGEIDRHLDELAYHYDHSENLPKRREYLRRAGVAAAARFANVEAIDYLGRALALAPADDREERYALLLARAQVYNLQGAREAQARDLEELRSLAALLGDPLREARVALEWSDYHLRTSDLPGSIAAAQTALERVRQAGEQGLPGSGAEPSEPARIASQANFFWGAALAYQGEFGEARVRHEEALALARSAGLRPEEARSLHGITFDLGEQGDIAQAIPFEEAALPIYREVGDKAGESGCLDFLGYLHVAMANYEAGGAYLEQGLRLARQIGFRLREINVLYHLGIQHHLMGDYAAAKADLEKCLAWDRETGDQRSAANRLKNICRSDRGLGQPAAACEHCREALAIYQSVGDRSGEASAWEYMAKALVDLGRLPEAAEASGRALAMLREHGAGVLATLGPLADLARIRLALGDTAQARGYADEILAYLDGGGSLESMEDPIPVYLACYHVLHAAADPRARELLGAGHELLQRRAARITDEAQRRSFLENVRAHRELVEAWAAG